MHNVSFMRSSHFYDSIEPVKQQIQRKIAIIFLFISLSQQDDSFDHPKHMFKLMGKNKIQFYAYKIPLSGSMRVLCVCGFVPF